MVKRDRAYTLIELLVSVTIVLVLTVVGVASYASVGKNARDARRRSDLEKVRVAMEIRKQEKGAYPGGIADLVTEGYIDVEPQDPRGFKYLYDRENPVASGFMTYKISAAMEVEKVDTKSHSIDNCFECFGSLAALIENESSCGCVCRPSTPSDCSGEVITNCSVKGCNYEVVNP